MDSKCRQSDEPLTCVARALIYSPALGTIRSLAYFLPVIDEVLDLTVSQDYFRYLRSKIAVFYPNASNLPTNR